MKKIKKYLSKKEYIIFALSLVIILLSTFSFAFYYSVDSTQESIVTSECFKLSFEDQNDINLDKAYPLSDSEGSNLKPYTFTIRNVCNKAGNYQVNIETLNNSTLSTNYLKYKLDNQTPDILGNQLEVQEYINNNVSESRNIEVGVILPNEEVTYNLRLWIYEESTFEQTSEKEYSGKVVVKTIDNKEPYQTITLNTNGGEITNNEIIKIKTRQIGELEEPTRLGYDFDGWYLDSALTNKINNNTIVTNEMNEIYAKYIPYQYTVTFNANGGTGSISSQTLTYDVPQNLNNVSLTKTDYTFAGWTRTNGSAVDYKNGAQVSNLTSENNGEITLYAVWVKNVTSFAYNGTNGTDGSVQNYKVLAAGTYKLETWGAQGGSLPEQVYTYQVSDSQTSTVDSLIGGYGGYSVGSINLLNNDNIYITVGSQGKLCASPSTECTGGYNGGGSAKAYTGSTSMAAAGGGATHIAKTTGILSTFSTKINDILIVSGAGGGAHFTNGWNGGNGGNAGGFVGNSSTFYFYHNGIVSDTRLSKGGTQSAGGCIADGGYMCGKFGIGGSSLGDNNQLTPGSGGGAGYYGGSGAIIGPGGGGSGYIGNSNLTNKKMVCYNCDTSNNVNTKTISNTCHNANPTADCAKEGNGYARITLVSLS